MKRLPAIQLEEMRKAKCCSWDEMNARNSYDFGQPMTDELCAAMASLVSILALVLDMSLVCSSIVFDRCVLVTWCCSCAAREIVGLWLFEQQRDFAIAS
jgi:hypothetical protein